MSKKSKILRILLTYLIKLRNRLSSQNFIVLISIIIGIIAGISAVLLKQSVHFVEFIMLFWLKKDYSNFPFFFYPLIGILLTSLYVKVFHREKFEKGLTILIYQLSKRKVDIDFHKTYSHVITSALTIGFGGSAGLEAPIVTTGSAIGSNIARVLKFSHKEKTLLIGCGAAAGIAGVFNSPIAGVIFVMEVLLSEFSIPAFIPLLISSAVGAVISKVFLPDGTLINFTTQGWEVKSIPLYFMLGIVCGLIGLYTMKVTIFMEEFSKTIKSQIRKALIGSIILGILIYLFPPLYGEGFHSISEIFKGNNSHIFDRSLFYSFNTSPYAIIIFSLCLIFLKVFASSITVTSGGNGGIIAPSLFIGAFTGFVFAFVVESTGIVSVRNENFIAVGMAGVLSGTINAPLTAIFLIAEGTEGYSLIVPLMIVSAMSFFTKRYFEPYSVYTKLIAERGEWQVDNTDEHLLSELKIENLIERDFITVLPTDTLRILTNKIAVSTRNLFAVVDKKGIFQGVVSLDDIREFMFTPEVYDIMIVTDVMKQSLAQIDEHESFDSIMEKFNQTNAWNLPVVSNDKFIGFISKSAVLANYREELIKQKKLIN